MSNVISTALNLGKKVVFFKILLLAVAIAPVSADDASEKVRGFFCDAKADQIAFLLKQAEGENEELAANAVNKSLLKQSCAYYLPVSAIRGKEQTVMSGGLVFKLQSFVFLPERVERWSGLVLGSLQQRTEKQDI